MECVDIWRYLSRWLDDINRLFIMITSKQMMRLDLLFEEEHHCKAIMGSSFYNNFINLKVDNVILIFKKINLMLPNKIRKIKFSHSFNHSIKSGMIPETVTHLRFSSGFTRKIKPGRIPLSVTHLRFSYTYKHDITKCLPPKLTYLNMGFGRCSTVPFGIEILVCSNNKYVTEKLPSSIKYLSVNAVGEDFVPSTTTYLKVFECYGLKKFPLVTHLTLSSGIVIDDSDKIPDGITHLRLKDDIHDNSTNFIIPTSVTHLTFGDTAHHLVKNAPASVTHLNVPMNFNEIENIPPSIKNVVFYESSPEDPCESFTESGDDSYSSDGENNNIK